MLSEVSMVQKEGAETVLCPLWKIRGYSSAHYLPVPVLESQMRRTSLFHQETAAPWGHYGPSLVEYLIEDHNQRWNAALSWHLIKIIDYSALQVEIRGMLNV